MRNLLLITCVALFLGQAGWSVARDRSTAAALDALRAQSQHVSEGFIVTSSPPGASVALEVGGAATPLGTAPVLVVLDPALKTRVQAAPARLRLSAPGYSGEVPLTTAYRGAPATASPLHVDLQPTLGPLSPLLLRFPLALVGALCGLAALALHQRERRRSEDMEEAVDTVTFIGPGGRIGRYRLDRLLGTGGMAEVYLATIDKSKVAVKVLLPEASGDAETRQRLEREFGITSGLEHPGIVRVRDAGEDGGRLFLAMDFVGGGTLRERIPLPWRDAAIQAAAIADALAYAHARGVVHRDLKPENVLLGDDGRPRVADFGLARTSAYQTITATGSLLGTPAYIAPEQISQPRSDPRADIYSLGCMLFEMIAGRLPFADGDLMQTIMSRLSDAPPPLRESVPDIPEALDTLVTRMLATDPSDRPESCEAVRDALRNL